MLIDIAEMSTSEAANILGVKEATVKTRVHRARLKLRQVSASFKRVGGRSVGTQA